MEASLLTVSVRTLLTDRQVFIRLSVHQTSISTTAEKDRLSGAVWKNYFAHSPHSDMSGAGVTFLPVAYVRFSETEHYTEHILY